jgi:hypothetical protein
MTNTTDTTSPKFRTIMCGLYGTGIHRRPSPEGLGRLVVQPSIVDMRFRLSEIVVVKVGVGAGGEEVTPAGEGVEVLVFPRFKEEDFLASFCL